MIAHALLTLYRSLSRHRLYAALNLLGLATGIAVFVVLTLVVGYERGFDRWVPDAAHIDRVDTTFFNPGQAPSEISDTSFVEFDLLRADYPQIRAATRLLPRDETVTVGETINSEPVTYVDPGFFDTIPLPLASGDPAQALSSPTSVVITEDVARKYFGTLAAIGRTIRISHQGVQRDYTVSAILKDLPADTTLRVRMLALITPAIRAGVTSFQRWGDIAGSIYLRFANRADANAVAADLGRFVARRASGTADSQIGPNAEQLMRLSLVRLPDAHFHDVAVRSRVPGVDPRIVASLGLVGLLALLTAIINYVNLATARSGLRAREVALRKTLGATRRMLVLQFLGEAVLLAALAGLIGLALTELAIPVVNALGGWSVHIHYLQLVPLLVLLVLLVGLGAGAYPAILLASYRPAAVLASSRTPAGGRMGTRLRNILVLAQFASAIAFGICTLVISAQAGFLRDADRGFDRQGLIVIRSLGNDVLTRRRQTIMDALRAVPGVVAATSSNREPNSDSTWNITVNRPGRTGPAPELVMETVGRDYFATYGIRTIAGRLFDDAHATDDSGRAARDGAGVGAILNARAVSALGYPAPAAALGQSVTIDAPRGRTILTIIGVVQDVRFMSPRDPVPAQLYLYDTTAFGAAEAAIRYRGVSLPAMMQRLSVAWHAVAPDAPLEAGTADERLADFYRPDQQRARLFSAGALLAVAIACVGLYGLASFNTARRTREIGIRKVLGARSADVLLLMVGQFIRPVLIANLVAWPVAWLAMRNWLAGFDQRIALSPGYFLVVSLVAIAISVLTVLGQALRVARAEPALALRHE